MYLKKIIKFIKNLKSQNVYDNSMIVIKSDHAKPNCNETHHLNIEYQNFINQGAISIIVNIHILQKW